MKKKPFISIITTNYNNARYVEETIKSVVKQNLQNFEYILIDGKSTDSSLKIIKKYRKYISYFESKKDRGPFHAIDKGIKKSRGEIIIWINSGDILDKNATKNVSKIFKSRPKIKWLNGRSGYIKKNFRFSFIPYYYPRDQIRAGLAHKKFWGYIQQESVSFRKSLYFKSKGLKTKKNSAGDYFLWKNFAKYEDLHPFFIKIGYFRTHHNQISSIKNYYEKDTGYISEKSNFNIERLIMSIIYLPKIIFKTFYIRIFN